MAVSGLPTDQPFNTKMSSPYAGNGYVLFTPSGINYNIKSTVSVPVRIALTLLIGTLIIFVLLMFNLLYISFCFFLLIYYAIGSLMSTNKSGSIPYDRTSALVFDTVSLQFNYTDKSGAVKLFRMTVYPIDVSRMQWVLSTRFSGVPGMAVMPPTAYGPPPPPMNYGPAPAPGTPPSPDHRRPPQHPDTVCPRCRRPMEFDYSVGANVCKNCARYNK